MPTFGDLVVDPVLHDAILEITGSSPAAERLWQSFAGLCERFHARNAALLARRDDLQRQIDAWHKAHQSFDRAAYKAFLEQIGYLAKDQGPLQVTTRDVDVELKVGGPQLVVPVDNARYALNAANARLGSLFDALYSTDILGSAPSTPGYDPVRGMAVYSWCHQWLDRTFPLGAGGSWGGADVTRVWHSDFCLAVGEHRLVNPDWFLGFTGTEARGELLLEHRRNQRVILVIDRQGSVGATHAWGLQDILIESAQTAIMDMEDSVASVDAQDKALVYQNWHQLRQGTLTATLTKGMKNPRVWTRTLNQDKVFTGRNGQIMQNARTRLLVRNVGIHLRIDAVTWKGEPIFESLLDALVSVTAAVGTHGGIYVVRPKLHGPEESAFVNELFVEVEKIAGLPKNAVKIGVMDEEKRTSTNLKETLRQVKERVVFINTGFLDRTGDEIHTCMQAGPVVRKGVMKQTPWLACYEKNNVAVGLNTGLAHRGQIGKGMWAEPNSMKRMLEMKKEQIMQGGSTAWVPSPIAAVVHALHYHEVDVERRWEELRGEYQDFAGLELLNVPIASGPPPSPDEVQQELEANIQSLLGYAVRWVDMGVGCSLVPDLEGKGLMEDCATVRISTQHVANWLHHKVVTKDQVEQAFAKMARVVEEQNKGAPIHPLVEGSAALRAAKELIFDGLAMPNGYVEGPLSKARREVKAKGKAKL